MTVAALAELHRAAVAAPRMTVTAPPVIYSTAAAMVAAAVAVIITARPPWSPLSSPRPPRAPWSPGTLSAAVTAADAI